MKENIYLIKNGREKGFHEDGNINYEVIQNGENININNNDNNNYLVNELVEVNQNNVENQINIETNENQEYFINSDDNINNENIPQENFNRSYILQSPLVKKNSIFFPKFNLLYLISKLNHIIKKIPYINSKMKFLI